MEAVELYGTLEALSIAEPVRAGRLRGTVARDGLKTVPYIVLVGT